MEKTNCIAPIGANPAFRDLIYDLMNGFVDLDEEPVPESQYVANEYCYSRPNLTEKRRSKPVRQPR